MLSNEIGLYLKNIEKKGQKVFDLALVQVKSAQNFREELNKEILKNEEVIELLSKEDWPEKNIWLESAIFELKATSHNSIKTFQICALKIELTQGQLKHIVDQINTAKTLSKENAEANLGLILASLGIAISVASAFISTGLLTGFGIAVSTAGLADSINNCKKKYEKLFDRQKRQVSDDIARTLFNIAEQAFQDLEQILKASLSAIKSTYELGIIKRIKETRYRWLTQAKLDDEKDNSPT